MTRTRYILGICKSIRHSECQADQRTYGITKEVTWRLGIGGILKVWRPKQTVSQIYTIIMDNIMIGNVCCESGNLLSLYHASKCVGRLMEIVLVEHRMLGCSAIVPV